MKYRKYKCYWCGHECCEGNMLYDAKELLKNLRDAVRSYMCPNCGDNAMLDKYRHLIT